MLGFKENLIKNFNFTESDWDITKDYFSIEIVEPKKHFIKEGEVADKLGFVKSGLLRSHYIDEDARDITLQFFQKGTVVVLPDSFNNGTPVKVNIVAYEKSELITITSERLKELYERVPRWQQICKDVSDIKNTQLLDRTLQFQTRTAKERYNEFCEEYPGIILKAPLVHIASYLGMDIATLSRLRSAK